MSHRWKNEKNEQRLLEEWLARSGARDTVLERMARDAVHEHRAGRTEVFPPDERDEPRR